MQELRRVMARDAADGPEQEQQQRDGGGEEADRRSVERATLRPLDATLPDDLRLAVEWNGDLPGEDAEFVPRSIEPFALRERRRALQELDLDLVVARLRQDLAHLDRNGAG